MGPLNHESEPWINHTHPAEVSAGYNEVNNQVMVMRPMRFLKPGSGMKKRIAEDMFYSIGDNFMLIAPFPWITPKMRMVALSNIIQGVQNVMDGKRYTD